MKDRFEDFIKQNRDDFDFRQPDDAIWNRLKNDIRIKSKTNWKLVMKQAAAVILIFAASYAINEMVHRYNSRGDAGMKARNEKIIPGLSEAETYYTSLINQKMDELKPVMANCPSLQEELNYDMSELDSVYTDLKSDLKDNMANQEVIEAIIENYRLKISILEDLLTEMESMDDACIPNKDGYAL
jgi:hypothetical protein